MKNKTKDINEINSTMSYCKGFVVASGYVNVTMGTSAFAFDVIQL